MATISMETGALLSVRSRSIGRALAGLTLSQILATSDAATGQSISPLRSATTPTLSAMMAAHPLANSKAPLLPRTLVLQISAVLQTTHPLRQANHNRAQERSQVARHPLTVKHQNIAAHPQLRVKGLALSHQVLKLERRADAQRVARRVPQARAHLHLALLNQTKALPRPAKVLLLQTNPYHRRMKVLEAKVQTKPLLTLARGLHLIVKALTLLLTLPLLQKEDGVICRHELLLTAVGLLHQLAMHQHLMHLHLKELDHLQHPRLQTPQCPHLLKVHLLGRHLLHQGPRPVLALPLKAKPLQTFLLRLPVPRLKAPRLRLLKLLPAPRTHRLMALLQTPLGLQRTIHLRAVVLTPPHLQQAITSKPLPREGQARTLILVLEGRFFNNLSKEF